MFAKAAQVAAARRVAYGVGATHSTFRVAGLRVGLVVVLLASLAIARDAWAEGTAPVPSKSTDRAELHATETGRPKRARSGHSPGTIRIADDYGGSVALYMQRVDRLVLSGRRVAIIGDCRSACTLYLGAGDVCVAPSATLRFHGPSRAHEPLNARQFETISRRMADYYPDLVRTWFLEHARYETEGTLSLGGAALIRMGVPEC